MVSIGSSIAGEGQSSQSVTPPPPAVTSSYFTAPAPTSSDNAPTPSEPSETPKNFTAPAPSLGLNISTSAHAPTTQTTSPAAPTPITVKAPAQTSSNIPAPVAPIKASSEAPAPVVPAPVAPGVVQPADSSSGSGQDQKSDTASSDAHDDSDASTGIRGAHVTKGIDFESASQEDAFSMGGVDTSHVKHVSGNWVEKKHYWQEIEELVDQVKEKITDIASKRTTFFATRSEVDKELSTFYQHVGLDQGPLQDMIHYSLEIMEKEKEQQGFLNKKERTFYEKAQSKQRIFEQLKEDVKAIGVIDTKMDEALEVVLKQVNACNEYEGEVWNIYKTVAYELSEKEAEQHYLVAKAFLKDIENIQMYLSGPFQTYFQELAESIQTHTQNIVMQLDALDKEGLNLKKEATIFETEEEQIQAEQAHKEELKKAEEKKSTQKSSVSKEGEKFSFVGYITDFYAAIKNSITGMIHKITGLFSGTKKKTDIPVAKKSVAPVKPTEQVSSHETPAQEHEVVSAHDESDKTDNVKVADKQPVQSEKTEKPAVQEKKSKPVVVKESELKETVQYDEERFAQEMAELEKSIEAGAHEVIEAPGELFHSLEKNL